LRGSTVVDPPVISAYCSNRTGMGIDLASLEG
jgi:hypothetical protein